MTEYNWNMTRRDLAWLDHVVYNEIEPYPAQWLRNLVVHGHIASGRVDTRSVEHIQPEDLKDAVQFHTFAGIGVWSYALRLAGWPDNRPVWTGSCPCQPFSQAGRRGGVEDPRHLWPAWFRLIRQCRPPVVFGEQVASPDGVAWLDLVQTDLEGAGYAFGAAILPAAGVGAPHGRHRIFWVAVSRGEGREQVRPVVSRGGGGGGEERLDERSRHSGAVGDATRPVGHTDAERAGRDGGAEPRAEAETQRERQGDVRRGAHAVDVPGPGMWDDPEWVWCRDGKWRPVEPGTFPLAHGAPARVGRLRAYGNAIVAEVAATFIRAFMDTESRPR